MPTQRTLFSRTMISLPLPAAILAVGTIGMAWASSNSPVSEPVGDTKGSSTSRPADDSGTVTTVRSERNVGGYWTPQRMRDAEPAKMPVVRGTP